MKPILIFAGTTEGRKLSERLCEFHVPHTVCVATEYGEIVLKEDPYLTVLQGRKTIEEMQELLHAGDYGAVVDATHPYAEIVTKNIRKAMLEFDVPYIRLQRRLEGDWEEGELRYFDSQEDCAEALSKIDGNVLLTTGSKELAVFCKDENLKKRLYVRVLPSVESLELCAKQGIQGKQILAMQGPFTEELNEAFIHQFQISCLVTKQSGFTGGYPQKLKAAKRAGIPCYVIGCPNKIAGDSLEEVCKKLEEICKTSLTKQITMEISLVGIGMGNSNHLTKEAEQKIQEADVILGAQRMIEPYLPRIEKKPYYLAKDMIPYLKKLQEMISENIKVVVLFSGDTGFYSGAAKLYQEFLKEISSQGLKATVDIFSGISSVSYLAAKLGESYQDAQILSIHGKKEYHLAQKIRTHRKTFLLLSGVKDLQELGKMFQKEENKNYEIWVGYQLSYPEEEIILLTWEECMEREKEGLYICCILNSNPEKVYLTHGISDDLFLREKVPMTKEEVREAVISKLQLYEGSVVADLGCGTGSIAIEVARISDTIFVYGVEKKKEAADLSKKNKERFEVDNLKIIEGESSAIIPSLPKLTHAFVGGSGGNLMEILRKLQENNPRMRIVMTAITMETICEMKEIAKKFLVEKEEIVQLQVNRAKEVGSYHLMQAENPVWIYAFQFQERE